MTEDFVKIAEILLKEQQFFQWIKPKDNKVAKMFNLTIFD